MRKSSEISSGTGEARDKSHCDRVTASFKYNRNLFGGILGSLHRRRRESEDRIHFEADQLFGQCRQFFNASFGYPIFDNDILSLDIPEIMQTVAKYVAPRHIHRNGVVGQISELEDSVWLLRLNGNVPRKEHSPDHQAN